MVKINYQFSLPKIYQTSKTPTDATLWPVSYCLDIPISKYACTNNSIYLDYAASTPIIKGASDAMMPWLHAFCGNPSALIHEAGTLANAALQQSHDTFANILNISPTEIFFTASATESNNLLLRGLATHIRRKKNKIIYGATEHASIAETAQALVRSFGSSHGLTCETLPVDSNGQILMEAAQKQIDGNTLCVCVMDVNNETGIKQTNLPQIIELAHAQNSFVHIDSSQGFARGDFFARELNWDSLCISSHKIYGPRGAALLAIKQRTNKTYIEPQLSGGKHEFGLRASTPNVAAIVGFAAAAKLQEQERKERNNHFKTLDAYFNEVFIKEFNATIIGNEFRVPGIILLSINNINAAKAIAEIKRVYIGLGSACGSGNGQPSTVARAMGITEELFMGIMRFSFGLPTNRTELRLASELFKNYRSNP